MIQANMHEAKTQLSKLIERAQAGEEVVIARNGKPAVRLQPVKPAPAEDSMDEARGGDRCWEAWKASDREMAAIWEGWLNAPEPWLEDRPSDPPPEEMERLRTLSLEDLVSELTLKR